MSSKEKVKKMVERYDWVGKEYCRLTGKNESLHKVNQEVFEEMSNDVLKDLCKLSKIENIMKQYNIADLTELEIALDYYYRRYEGGVNSRRVEIK